MISRRKILSRSLDNLDAIEPTSNPAEEDVWYDSDKLCRDHIQEVLDKWEQIDDEIWAKVIVFERNRRVAKAYARSPVITVNGSKHGFDGMRIGLNGFDNPMRDSKTLEAKKSVGEGFKMKMDETGCILVKRYGKNNVFAKSTTRDINEETVIGADILKLPNYAVQVGKSGKLFDMKKFTMNINREFSRSYPDRRRLERQCLSAVSLVKTEDDLLNCPLWILVINVVAIDMLKNKMMAFPKIFDLENRSPASSSNEDPYSVIGSQIDLTEFHPAVKMMSARNNYHHHQQQVQDHSDSSLYEPKPDYESYERGPLIKPNGIIPKSASATKPKERKKQDDPYYCGLLARIPNFIKSSSKNYKNGKNKESKMARKISAQHISHPILMSSHKFQHQFHQQQPHPATFSPFLAQPYPTSGFKLYSHGHPLSQSQFSLWDSRSMIAGVAD